MLKLKPSARMKKRYLLINGSKKNIEKAILEYLGVLGLTKASPIFVRSVGGKEIVAIDRGEVDRVLGAFGIYDGKIEVLKISGTLKGLVGK